MVEGSKWRQISKNITLKYRKVKATRGNIYSNNGSLLATSVPFYRVAFDPTVAGVDVFDQNLDSLSYLLSHHFKDQSEQFYHRRINDARLAGRQYLILNKTRIGYQQKKEMERWPLFREGRLGGGVIFEKVEKRLRPFSYLGSRTIGYINENNFGAGLEYSFNRLLSGSDGRALFRKMAGGNWKPVYDDSEIRPVQGLDIETTIDVNLQDLAESALLKALMLHRADYGSVAVMEVKTGEIRALSNLSRDGNGGYREIYNYAVGSQGVREPGSTFKLASMVALLEDSHIELTDSIETGNGEFKFHNTTMRDHEEGGFGTLTVQQVFEKSSNIGIAKMVVEHFGDRPQDYIDNLKSMGLADPLGFHMIGEGKPFIKDPSDSSWSGLTLPWMSHGYELKISPLHTLAFYNAVANNGQMIRPIIVKHVRQADRTVETYKTKVLRRQICSQKTLEKVKIMLRGVVEKGTARQIQNEYYTIAGKTGTAQKIVNGRYSNKYYTSFVGYFPAENPRFSCIVVIDNPKGYYQYGSDVAAPVFREIADRIYTSDYEMHIEFEPVPAQAGVYPTIRSGFRPDLELICKQLNVLNTAVDHDDWVKTRTKEDTVFWISNKQYANLVPDVTGMTLKDAIYLLENKGLRVDFDGLGRVRKQSLRPGSRAPRGRRIRIELG